ncbi:MAG: metallophosphoesterase, partial [Bacteroidota bacterium]
MSFRILIILAILFIIDLYAFQSVKFLTRGLPQSQIRTAYYIYWAVSIFCFGLIIIGNIFDWHQWNKAFRTYSFAFVFILFFSKLFVDIFLLIDDLIRLFRWSGTKIISLFGTPDSTKAEVVRKGISRADFLVKMAVVVGAIPFFSMIYGMINGAYNYRKRKVILT